MAVCPCVLGHFSSPNKITVTDRGQARNVQKDGPS